MKILRTLLLIFTLLLPGFLPVVQAMPRPRAQSWSRTIKTVYRSQGFNLLQQQHTTTPTIMDIHGFYKFESKVYLNTFQIDPVRLRYKSEEYVHGLADSTRLLKGDYRDIEFPVYYEQCQGHKLRDILHDTSCFASVVSDKLKSVLVDNGLTGWKTFPVDIWSKKKERITGYHGFSVVGRCGPIDRDGTPIIQKRFVETGPLVDMCKGIYPDLDQWDGSDFFMASDYIGILLSPKGYKALKAAKLNGIQMEHLPDIEIYKSIWIDLYKRSLPKK